ncbi:PAS domain S-box-containing protein [Terriglobus roseus]|uniref:histidine kinase n=2 Tax=Terriglobus roseus TaxID=392734 RepID=A0A1H4T0H6_9BACT|nr:PAS domain S-box-containing protein [Terriglobus roseus]
MLGVFLTWVVISQRNLAQERTSARIAGQLQRLSMASARQLARGDLSSLQDILELAEIAPTIQATRLTDLAGKTLAVSNAGRDRGLDAQELKVLPTATTQQIFKIRNGQPEAVTPVLWNGKAIALLWLEPNPSISFSTANTVARIALTYGAFALLANLLPIFLFTQAMTRPLRRLSSATQSVVRNAGREDVFPLPVTTANEAGVLTVNFNTMVRELEEQRSGLLETLALLDSMLGNAPIGFAFFDRDFRFVRLNGFFTEMSGQTHAAHIGARVVDIHAGDFGRHLQRCVAAVFQNGKAMRDVELAAEPTGDGMPRRTWLMNFYPVRTQADAVRWVGVIVSEITDRLAAEEKLRKTEKLAAAGRLAASVAHEINNPLEAVTNLLYILRHHQPMDEQAVLYIEMAQGELARVAEITQQTLRFYRQSVSRSRTDIAEVMTSIVTLYQPRMTAARVTVVKDFREGTELLCFGGEIRQLLANLIVNAVDAMQAGGILSLRARHGSGRLQDGAWGEGVHVSVADTGMGMSPQTMAKIFEAFFTTKQATGTGLGLWVSEEIIRKHGGSIRVRSRQGEHSGTCFWMFFPYAAAVDGKAVETAPASSLSN